MKKEIIYPEKLTKTKQFGKTMYQRLIKNGVQFHNVDFAKGYQSAILAIKNLNK